MRTSPPDGARVCNVAIPVVIAALFAATAAVAIDNLRVGGTVSDMAGQPVIDAKITMIEVGPDGAPLSSGVPLKGKSDKKGRFNIAFVKAGDYRVEVDVGPGLVLRTAAVRLRDRDRKIPFLPDGTRLEDVSGSIDPRDPVVRIGIPKIVWTVEMDLTVGPPEKAAPSGPSPEIVARNEALRHAVSLIEDGSFQEGYDELNRALSTGEVELSDDDKIAVAYLKGYALVMLQRGADAEPHIREAMMLKPDLPTAHHLLAQSLLQQRRFEDAAAELRAAIDEAATPEAKQPLQYNLGQALLELGKTSEAIPPLEQAHAADPSDQGVVVQLINAYTLAGRVDDADKLIGADLPDAEAGVLHFNLAANLATAKNYPAAEKHLREALGHNPELVDAHRVLGEVCLAQNKPAEAIAALEAYLAAAPDAPDAGDTRELIKAIRSAMPKKK